MNTFDKFKKSTEDLFGGGREEQKEEAREVRQDRVDDDNEFEFDVPEESSEDVTIEDVAGAAVETPYEINKMNVTKIGEDTIITGDVRTKGHIDVLGTIKGNIDADGNVAIRSDIKGNIKGNNIGFGACVVTGNIEAAKNVLADVESDITGNIKGSEISIAGHVSGDIKADKVIVLKKDAVMEGDIDTDGLVVEPGAIMNGKVSISRKPKKMATKSTETIAETRYEPTPPPVTQPAPELKPEAKPEPGLPVAEKKTAIDVDDDDITDI